MNIIGHIFKSSLGKKYVMGISGCVLFLFVVAHLLGNLQIFLGREAINRYGHFLQSNLELVWPARIALLLMLILHVWAAVKLTVENRAARPVPYGQFQVVAASYASRTMMMSGLIVFCFVVYHLLHFTLQNPQINLTGQNFHDLIDAAGRHDVYGMMILGFSNKWVSTFYIVGMALLCLHLSHGVASMFQSVGWKREGYSAWINAGARIVAGFIFLGYASIPVAVLLGLIQ